MLTISAKNAKLQLSPSSNLLLLVSLLYCYSKDTDASFRTVKLLANWLGMHPLPGNKQPAGEVLHQWFFLDIVEKIALASGQRPAVVLAAIEQIVPSVYLE